MGGRRRRHATLGASRCAWSLALFVGCDGCRDDHLAELVVIHDAVDRDRAEAAGKWQRATEGDRFRVGDGVRTGPRGNATLKLLPEGELRVKSDTVVRFQSAPPGRPERLQVEAGEIELESAGVEVEVQTSGGVARLTRGSRVAVRHGGGKVRFDVALGNVQVEREGGALAAAAGQSFSVDVGPLAIEAPVPAPVTPEPAPVPLQVTDAGLAAAEAIVVDVGGLDASPARAHVAVPGGESAIVHDARAPTHVAIGLEGCAQGGVVEVARGGGAFRHFRAQGQGRAIVSLAAGSYRYRVRCLQHGRLEAGAEQQGRLQVLRDAAVRRLPRTPPSVEIDADGRRYTVRYQNLLPKLTLRWPGAPQAASYEIELRSEGGGSRREQVTQPRHVLRSGDLGEGEHQFRFTASDGTRSPESVLRIAFDNTARTAYLSEPSENVARAGTLVHVAGAALRGSSVTAHGAELPLGDQGRFSADVTAPADADALAIRVHHPSTGVHYYLRHLVGPGQ